MCKLKTAYKIYCNITFLIFNLHIQQVIDFVVFVFVRVLTNKEMFPQRKDPDPTILLEREREI